MKERIYSLDVIRAIAAYWIVSIHFNTYNYGMDYFSVLEKTAVSIFFLISGYFIAGQKEFQKKSGKQIKKYLTICLIMNVVDLTYNISVLAWHNLRIGKAITYNLDTCFEPFTRIRFWLFNFGNGGYLWYLRALIYLIVFIRIMRKFKLEKAVKVMILISIIVDLVMTKYQRVIFGDVVFDRAYAEPISKFIGMGFVFLFLGYFIREKLDQKSEWMQKVIASFRNHTMRVWIIFTLVLACGMLEYHVMKQYDCNVSYAISFFTKILALMIFFLALSRPEWGKDSFFYHIGRDYSLYIYLLHVPIGKVLVKVCGKLSIYVYVQRFRSFLIYGVTICIIWIAFRIKRKIESRKSAVYVDFY